MTTDEQFDDLAKKALAYDPGPPSEAVWNRARPVRFSWLPTVREILVCGSACALALCVLGIGIERGRTTEGRPIPVIQAAMHDETRFVLSSVTRVDGAERFARVKGEG